MALGIVIHRDRYLLGRPQFASSAAYTVDRSKNLLKTNKMEYSIFGIVPSITHFYKWHFYLLGNKNRSTTG